MTDVLHLPARLDAPIACDMTTAVDTPDERLAEYGRVFDRALVRRERGEHTVALTFRASPETQATVERLARREAACCPFADYSVQTTDDEVVLTITGDRDGVDEMLDAFYALPDLQLGLAGADDRRAGMFVDAMGLGDLDVVEAGVVERDREVEAGHGAGDAADVLLHVLARGGVHVGVGDHVRDGEVPARLQDPRGLADHAALVGGEVDHAVGDHDVDRVVLERDLLDVAFEPMDVLDTGLRLVGACEGEHLVGHIEAVRGAARGGAAGGGEGELLGGDVEGVRGAVLGDGAGGEQDVDAAAVAEVEHAHAGLEVGHRR